MRGTANLVRTARSLKVRRFIQMSALGKRPDGKTQYQQTKFRAEECIRTSGLDYTIFRPSIIFGPGDKFVNLFANMLKIQQFVPVVGNGRYQMQPVAVENVSMGFIKSIEQKTPSVKLSKSEDQKRLNLIKSLISLVMPYAYRRIRFTLLCSL